jgi:hypothetical protein
MTKSSVHPVLKTSSWRISVLIQTDRRIDRRRPHSDRRIIWCYCLSLLFLCNSSGASRNWTIGSSDGVSFILSTMQCTNYTNAMHRWYCRFIRWRVFFSFLLPGFDPRKRDYLLNFACGILAYLGPRNVYKNMLNNMVSPIDHVVMNHQNQTRTNGIWGHVRYTRDMSWLDTSTVLVGKGC